MTAGLGLIAGLWAPLLGVATAVALGAYFLIAIGVHIRAGDPPKKSMNAIGMLALTAVAAALTYLPAV